ncbi:MAG: hypothetical protein EOM03_12240 [Clostridia bacterium]|nr:hypothetical protein [Clostridia bacterium]
MDRENLQLILKIYTDNFDFFVEHENYKWLAIQHFQSRWEPDAPDFGEMFWEATAATYNLIDSRYAFPRSGIVELAKHEPDTVRQLFAHLYADDGGDLINRQDRVNDFVADAAVLLERYVPGSWKMKQDLRTVLTYLNLRHPDDNFLYKSSPAHAFAKIVDFGNSFGSGKSSKLANYYQMCNELLAHLQNMPSLLDLNLSRLGEGTWSDSQLHLLASDIIYCVGSYTELFRPAFFTSFDPKTKAAREHQAILDQHDQNLEAIQAELDEVREAKADLAAAYDLVGVVLRHRSWGAGTVLEEDGDKLRVRFAVGDKRLLLSHLVKNGLVDVIADVPVVKQADADTLSEGTIDPNRPSGAAVRPEDDKAKAAAELKEYFITLVGLLKEEDRLVKELTVANAERRMAE